MKKKYFVPFIKTFKILSKTDNLEDLKHILSTISKHILKFFIECAYNILKGEIFLTEFETTEAKKYKKLFKKLISKNISKKSKLNILIKNISFTKLIVNIALQSLDG